MRKILLTLTVLAGTAVGAFVQPASAAVPDGARVQTVQYYGSQGYYGHRWHRYTPVRWHHWRRWEHRDYGHRF